MWFNSNGPSRLSSNPRALARQSARRAGPRPRRARRLIRLPLSRQLLGALLPDRLLASHLPHGALLLTVLALLAGCGSSGPAQRDQFYTLQPELVISPSHQRVPGSLLVTPLASRGFLGGTQILFRTADAPLQVQRYDALLWDEAPGRALSEALIAALRASGSFQFVVSVADRARADFILNGELTRLEHLPTATPPQVSAAFNLTLIAQQDRSIQFAHSYSGQAPTAANTPEAMARAFNRLTGRLLTQAMQDLQRLAPTLKRTLASDG
ncbi:hypothetical protein CCR96_17455 [Halochromatium roseum]|nr:hypothetical protein [Halochromatium roseum]